MERDGAAVQLFQQHGHLLRNQIDDLQLHGFSLRHGYALTDGIFRPGDVPSPLLGDRFDVGHGIVLDLLLHRLVHLAPAHSNGMGGTDIRTGSHRRDMGRQGDKYAGGSGTSTRWRHVDDHGNGSAGDVLDNEPHRSVETAGRIETDDQGLRPGVLRRGKCIM